MNKHLGPCRALNCMQAFGYEPGEPCGDDGHAIIEDGDHPQTVCYAHAAVARDGTYKLEFPPVDLHGLGRARTG